MPPAQDPTLPWSQRYLGIVSYLSNVFCYHFVRKEDYVVSLLKPLHFSLDSTTVLQKYGGMFGSVKEGYAHVRVQKQFLVVRR